MIRYLITVLSFSLLSPNLFAQEKDSAQDYMLWQVSGNGLQSPSYLYGTIHLICVDDVNISELAKEKLASCKQLFLEVAPLAPKDTSLKKIALQGTTLEKLVDKKYFEKAKELLKNEHLTDSSLNMTSAYWVYRLIADCAIGCVRTSIDDSLAKMAHKSHIPIAGLESITESETPVNSIPLWKQVDNLKHEIDDFDNLAKRSLQMISLYLDGDLEKLYQQTCCDRYGDKTEQAVNFLDKRNKLWIPKMVKAMTQQCSFFAFGCAHLVSEMGIINLLIKKGYTVTPMMYAVDKNKSSSTINPKN